jgi:hypothetical protein
MRIIPCTCTHQFQDERYGKGMRLHNETMKGEKENRQYRCTVCRTLHTKNTPGSRAVA